LGHHQNCDRRRGIGRLLKGFDDAPKPKCGESPDEGELPYKTDAAVHI
jgi:hypothetical protein